MRKHLLVAGIAVATLLPSLALAQETCEQRSADRTTGTVVGAVAGALIGSAVAGHGDRGTGAAIGGIGGAIAANQMSRGDRDCAHAYGFYDNGGRWHANAAQATAASGYYDRRGGWVDGQPNGYYDSRGEWAERSTSGDNRGDNRGGAYGSRAHTWDIDTQISRLDDRIQRGRADGSLSRPESRRAQFALNDIRREERNEMRNGRLSGNEEVKLQGRLDALANDIRLDRQN